MKFGLKFKEERSRAQGALMVYDSMNSKGSRINLEFGIRGLGLRMYGLEFVVYGSEFSIKGRGFSVSGQRLRV